MELVIPPDSGNLSKINSSNHIHVDLCDDSIGVTPSSTALQQRHPQTIPESLQNGVKRSRSSCDDSQLKTSEFASNDDFQMLFNSFTLRERFRNKFKSIVQITINDILKPIHSYGKSIDQLQREIEELQRRLSKLEVSSNKINALILESPVLSKPTVPISSLSPSQQSCPRTAPISLNNQLPLQQQSNGLTPYQNPVSPFISNAHRLPSLQSPPLRPSCETTAGSNNKNSDTIDLTVDLKLQKPRPIPSSTHTHPRFNNPRGLASFPQYRVPRAPRIYRPRQPRQSRPPPPQTRYLPPPRQPPPLQNFHPHTEIAMASMHELAKESVAPLLVAPLPPWTHYILPVDVLGRPTALHVQPALRLVISSADEGICLRWELLPTNFEFEFATSYELFSYASSDVEHLSVLTHQVWQKVGDVTALPLPMACTLTSVVSNNIYYFVVRSVDQYQRVSDWSNIVNAHVN